MALNIADLFEHAVDAAPDKPAVQVGERAVTYAELEGESNRLAHYFLAQGIEPGQHIGLYAKNSVEHVIALMAIFKVRAVAINVNYRYVAGELEYLFDNADLVGLVHDRVYAPLVAEVLPKTPRLGVVVAVPNGPRGRCHRSRVTASTGRPTVREPMCTAGRVRAPSYRLVAGGRRDAPRRVRGARCGAGWAVARSTPVRSGRVRTGVRCS